DAYLDLLAGQRVIHRPPVHPRGLHRHIADPYLRQPGRHLLQLPPERRKPPHGHRPPARLTRQPHRDPDHLLAHIDPGDARMDDIHRHLLPQPPILDTGTPPAEPAQDRDPVTRARSSNPGYPPGRLQRQSSKQARSAKVGRRQRTAQPQVSSIRGRHDSGMKSSITYGADYPGTRFDYRQGFYLASPPNAASRSARTRPFTHGPDPVPAQNNLARASETPD